jgi:hypothetical protein
MPSTMMVLRRIENEWPVVKDQWPVISVQWPVKAGIADELTKWQKAFHWPLTTGT